MLDDPSDSTPVRLLYGNRSVDDILLRKELDELAAKHPEQLTLTHIIGASADDPAPGIPTPPSPLFLGRFSPVLRRFSAVPLHCPTSWRGDGENGRKMAENGRNLGEKRARNSGG